MKALIQPGPLKGSIKPPSSKSHTLRAILLASFAKGQSVITNPLLSKDTMLLIDQCKQIGAKIEIEKKQLIIEGNQGRFALESNQFNAGNSGIILRFLTALLALQSKPFVMTGDQSIQTLRPIEPLLDALSQLGASSSYLQRQGFAPFRMQGGLLAGEVTIDGFDSQPVSAMIFASMFLSDPVTIHIKGAKEIPWLKLTLWWLDFLNVRYQNDNFERITVFGKGKINSFHFDVPADFSSSSYWLAASVIKKSEIEIQNLNFSDPQGDKKLIDIFLTMGAKIDTFDTSLHVKASKLMGQNIDIDPFIDQLVFLAVIATQATTPTILYNGWINRKKECDRIACIVTELKKMNAKIEEKADGVVVRPSRLHGAKLQVYQDHRLALSLSMAALMAEGNSEIDGVECIEKTYANFYEELKRVGANVELLEPVYL